MMIKHLDICANLLFESGTVLYKKLFICKICMLSSVFRLMGEHFFLHRCTAYLPGFHEWYLNIYICIGDSVVVIRVFSLVN